MAEKIDDGGPAFPVPSSIPGGFPASFGLSLRDWFAAKAMQGIVGTFRQTLRGKEEARTDADADLTTFYRDMALDWNFKTGEEDGANEIASDAYIIADAMLKAREAVDGNH